MKRLRALLLAASVAAAFAPARAGIILPGPDYRPCDPKVETCPPCDPAVQTCSAAANADSSASVVAAVFAAAPSVVVRIAGLLP